MANESFLNFAIKFTIADLASGKMVTGTTGLSGRRKQTFFTRMANGIILPANDPWWDTHTPPNGWHCRCRKEPTREPVNVDDAKYKLISAETLAKDPLSGRMKEFPKGVDPAFAYNPANGAWETGVQTGKWQSIPEKQYLKNYENYNLPERLPAIKPPEGYTPYKEPAKTENEVKERLMNALGDGIFKTPINLPVVFDVNNTRLADHIIDHKNWQANGRDRYFPLIRDLLEKPQEIWGILGKTSPKAKISMRLKFVKVYDLDKDKSLIIIIETNRNEFSAVTFIPSDKQGAIKSWRRGIFLYGEKK